jgi:hypothetical protein
MTETTMRKRRPIKKQQRPIILWENKTQLAIWEIVLKGEIDAGFWSKSKFPTIPYLTATAIVYPKKPGTTIVPSIIGFNFGSKEFNSEQGYYIGIIMKLVERFDLEIQDLHKLAVFADSLVMVDYKDDNSDYRRIQVSRANISERNIPEEYKNTLGETVKYFRNLGVDMNDVTACLIDEPFTKTQIRRVLDRMSIILKTKVDYEELIKLSKS